MSKVVLTDLDEVIFDWQGPFERWINETGRYQPTKPLSNFWDIEQWLEIPYDEGRELVQEFNHSEKFGWLEPKPYVSECIDKLQAHGWSFVAITACATDYNTYQARWKNLQEHFGRAFDTLHCVGLGESKAAFLKRYHPTYWVEDKGRHAYDGADLGHRSFLIDYAWNRDYTCDRVKRVKDWREITEDILQKAETAQIC